MRRRSATIVVPFGINPQGPAMRVTIEDIGVREYDANRFDVDSDGFVLLTKGSNLVAAIPSNRVILIEMAG